MSQTSASPARRGVAAVLDDRPMRTKLAVALGVALVGAAVVGITGVVELQANTRVSTRLQTLQQLTRVSLEADMAHDAIRGDVQQLVASRSPCVELVLHAQKLVPAV